jgi:hypothetical protein
LTSLSQNRNHINDIKAAVAMVVVAFHSFIHSFIHSLFMVRKHALQVAQAEASLGVKDLPDGVHTRPANTTVVADLVSLHTQYFSKTSAGRALSE